MCFTKQNFCKHINNMSNFNSRNCLLTRIDFLNIKPLKLQKISNRTKLFLSFVGGNTFVGQNIQRGCLHSCLMNKILNYIKVLIGFIELD
jgi:hypothetical protein